MVSYCVCCRNYMYIYIYIYLSYTFTMCNNIQEYGFCSYSCRFINLFKLLLYRVIHKSVKHVRKLADATVE